MTTRCSQPTGLGKAVLGGFCSREGKAAYGGRCWQHRAAKVDYAKAKAERIAKAAAEAAPVIELRNKQRRAAQRVLDIVAREAAAPGGHGTKTLLDLYDEIKLVVSLQACVECVVDNQGCCHQCGALLDRYLWEAYAGKGASFP